MIRRIAKWLPEIPEAVIPGDEPDSKNVRQIGTSDDAQSERMSEDVSQKTSELDQKSALLADEPLGPPRPIDPNAGAVQIGPLNISARFSLVLIFWAVVIFNVLLIFGVIIVALMKSGRL